MKRKLNLILTGAVMICSLPAFSSGVSEIRHFANERSLNTEITVNEHSQSKMKKRNAPKGVEHNYLKTSAGTCILGNSMVLYEDDFPGIVIFSDNNKVYFKNMLSTFPLETWVEGELSGDIITVPTGQVVAESEEENFVVTLDVYQTVPDGPNSIKFEAVPDIKNISFKVGTDGSLKLQLPGEPFDGENPSEYSAGFTYSDYGFTGYCDFMQEYEQLELNQIKIPEDAEIENYVYIDQFNFASIVDVAFHGDYLYVRGLNSMLPEGTIRARIDGDKAFVEQNEYLGVYYDMYYIFTKILYENPEYNEDDEESDPFVMAPEDAVFTLNIDWEGKRIYTDKEGVYLSFHCNENDFLNSLGLYGIFELKYQSSFAGTPANPVDLEFTEDWVEYQGWSDFFFTLSNFSTDGMVLDADKLYYKVFVDGVPVIFYDHEMENLLGETAQVYPGVPIETELIPYFFDNNLDIFKYADNIFDVGIYTYVEKTIGVQTVYFFENKFYYSDIVTLNIITGEITETGSGVDTPAYEQEISYTQYYTLDGKRISHPDKGIYIRADILTDGTRKVSKILK